MKLSSTLAKRTELQRASDQHLSHCNDGKQIIRWDPHHLKWKKKFPINLAWELYPNKHNKKRMTNITFWASTDYYKQLLPWAA